MLIDKIFYKTRGQNDRSTFVIQIKEKKRKFLSFYPLLFKKQAPCDPIIGKTGFTVLFNHFSEAKK